VRTRDTITERFHYEKTAFEILLFSKAVFEFR